MDVRRGNSRGYLMSAAPDQLGQGRVGRVFVPFEEEVRMRSPTWAAALVVGLLFAGCARQSTIESAGDVAVSPAPADARSLPSGTTIDVRLDQEIGTKSSKVGDTFTATVTNPIVATNGATTVPAGSKIQGKITGLDTSDR